MGLVYVRKGGKSYLQDALLERGIRPSNLVLTYSRRRHLCDEPETLLGGLRLARAALAGDQNGLVAAAAGELLEGAVGDVVHVRRQRAVWRGMAVERDLLGRVQRQLLEGIHGQQDGLVAADPGVDLVLQIALPARERRLWQLLHRVQDRRLVRVLQQHHVVRQLAQRRPVHLALARRAHHITSVLAVPRHLVALQRLLCITLTTSSHHTHRRPARVAVTHPHPLLAALRALRLRQQRLGLLPRQAVRLAVEEVGHAVHRAPLLPALGRGRQDSGGSLTGNWGRLDWF